MINVFKEILEICLSTPDNAEALVLLPDTQIENKLVGGFPIPKDIFPENYKFQCLPNGDDFINSLRGILSQSVYSNFFIFPPLLSHHSLPKYIRDEFPHLSLEQIVLKLAVESLPSGSLLGITLPSNFFYSQLTQNLQKDIFQNVVPHFLISHENFLRMLGLNSYSSIQMYTLIVKIEQNKQSPLRFFKYSEVTDESHKEEIISDFQRLCKQGGGITKKRYGYVITKGLSPGEQLIHDKYHPDFQKMQEDIAIFGSVRPLNELCTIYRGLHRIQDKSQLLENDKNQLLEENSNNSIPVIEARDILLDGSLCTETRYRAIMPVRFTLKAGDICLREIFNITGHTLPIVDINEEMLPITALESVIVLRPNPSVTAEEREILIAFFRSNVGKNLFNKLGLSTLAGHARLSPKSIGELPVPIPDTDLSSAIKSLNEASRQFERWKLEANEARNQLFNFISAKDTRLHILTVGRQARQRQESAKLIDEFEYRVRTRFPHPIAYRWRIVEFSHPDLEGYLELLNCAEATICYLAQVCILLANSLDIKIGYMKTMAERISTSKSGTNLGDWIAIIREVCTSKNFRNISGYVPFYEVLKFLNEDVNVAITNLKKFRDDQAHDRGPKGKKIIEQYKDAKSYLEILLKNIEFLSEYPLRYIENTQRDSIDKITYYSYRDLMGDHPIVPIKTGNIQEPEIEAKSLYLVDRNGKIHLLRPLLTRRENPATGYMETFYLDTYEKETACSTLKSLENGSQVQNSEIYKLFKQIGLLLPYQ
jgi:hypothetical protein